MAYTFEGCIRSLNQKRSIKVSNGTITYVRNADDIGIKSFGMMDYLKKVYGYTINPVDTLDKKGNRLKQNDSDDTNVSKPKTKVVQDRMNKSKKK